MRRHKPDSLDADFIKLLQQLSKTQFAFNIQSVRIDVLSQKHDLLDGTKGHVLNLGKEEQEMVIEVVTEKGSVDITAKDQNGEIITEIEIAETGTYNFSANGKVKFRIYCSEHKGSISVYEADY